MSRVLIDSITRLCVADHGNHAEAVAEWTANKSEAGLRAMLEETEHDLFVAVRDDAVVAVGAVGGNAITLNYVDPAHRGTGVSRVLLAALEQVLRERGVTTANLQSTQTARQFYLSSGWQETGSTCDGGPLNCLAMQKSLAG